MDSRSELTGQVALVTGASRGVGRGIADVLAQAGTTVYVTGRTVSDADLPAAVIRMPCDHGEDAQVLKVFDQIRREQGRLDILVNNAWGMANSHGRGPSGSSRCGAGRR